MKKIAFIVPPAVELLDLAGPVQVFTEAKSFGFEAGLEFYCFDPETICSAGLPFGKLKSFKTAELSKGDYLFIPGVDFDSLERLRKSNKAFVAWLKESSDKQVNICSVCNAAFVLGEAGLLDHRRSTTHWKRIPLLKEAFPKTKVLEDILYVKSGNIYTSAGISSGIDLALSILEELKGPLFVTKVARNLVVYNRRNHDHTQQSIYLDYRNHVNPKVHEVQDYLIKNLSAENTLEALAEKVFISPRNLSRIFKKTTGTTIGKYITKLRLERAKTLRNNPEFTIDFIASEVGFKTPRQLQKLLKNEKERI
jgi:transcriptional regulator GlxA family with amidase domain